MLGANLAFFILLGQVPTVDPAALVARLGSARYAEREEAASALERLGRLAIPALCAVRDARDLEIRTRASALFNKIEGVLVDPAHPGHSRLRGSAAPRGREGAERSDRDQARADPRELAKLAEPADHRARAGPGPLLEGDGPALRGGAAPVQLRDARRPQQPGTGLPPPRRQSPRGRPDLGQRPVPDQPAQHPLPARRHLYPRRRPPAPRPVPPAPVPPGFNTPAAEGASVNEQFYAQVQVAAEPRLSLSLNGPLKILEAIDDRGQSLLPDPAAGPHTQGLRVTSA